MAFFSSTLFGRFGPRENKFGQWELRNVPWQGSVDQRPLHCPTYHTIQRHFCQQCRPWTRDKWCDSGHSVVSVVAEQLDCRHVVFQVFQCRATEHYGTNRTFRMYTDACRRRYSPRSACACVSHNKFFRVLLAIKCSSLPATPSTRTTGA